jgi:hypothetical protein
MCPSCSSSTICLLSVQQKKVNHLTPLGEIIKGKGFPLFRISSPEFSSSKKIRFASFCTTCRTSRSSRGSSMLHGFSNVVPFFSSEDSTGGWWCPSKPRRVQAVEHCQVTAQHGHLRLQDHQSGSVRSSSSSRSTTCSSTRRQVPPIQTQILSRYAFGGWQIAHEVATTKQGLI